MFYPLMDNVPNSSTKNKLTKQLVFDSASKQISPLGKLATRSVHAQPTPSLPSKHNEIGAIRGKVILLATMATDTASRRSIIRYAHYNGADQWVSSVPNSNGA
jgi:hypothetical protein